MFLHGCNYPWSTDGSTVFYGLDFGRNVWGSHLGVSTRREGVARDFDGMARLGFTVARWFVFCDGRSGIVYDERGFPASLDAHVLDDLDTGLEVAGDAGIRLALVLLDHRWMFSGLRDAVADPATGMLFETALAEGRSPVLRTRAGQDALFANVIGPVVRRFGRGGVREDLGDRVLAWELMNEPDFVVEEWEQDLSGQVPRPLPFAVLAELIARLSDLVHAHTRAFSTLGGARARNLWAWDDDALGLDVLQVHQYPDRRHPERDENLFTIKWAELDLERPVIIGEFPGDPLRRHPRHTSPEPIPLDEYVETALAYGYGGAWPWSFSGTDAYGRVPAEALRRFGRRHPELVNPRFDAGSAVDSREAEA